VADDREHDDDAPLTEAEILQFGPIVESAVWTISWLEEKRAPIAVAAGRPKLGPIFNSDGVGKAVVIRPCMSRGRRVRGLSPIYTPRMLEANARVFAGWPSYFDHVPADLAEKLAKRGRSVREIGGQIMRPWWQAGFTQEDDEAYGYQPGAVLTEYWATPYLRSIVGNNPGLLHLSISAWPTSGKPGAAPWAPQKKGMVIEGIRSQPQGSVDVVPRGGAGGRWLVTEGADPDEAAWPEPGWSAEDVALVVSLSECPYADRDMANENGKTTPPDFSKMTPAAFRAWVAENASHLSAALAESEENRTDEPANGGTSLTMSDVKRLIAEAEERAAAKAPDLDALREELLEEAEERIAERDTQRDHIAEAHRIIERAEGISDTWKTDLKGRYVMEEDGPSERVVIAEADLTGKDDDGKAVTLTELEVIRGRVADDLDHARDLIAEAQGKPRVKGEGGGSRDTAGDERPKPKLREGAGEKKEIPYWRQAFAEAGIAESADDALAIYTGAEPEKAEAK